MAFPTASAYVELGAATVSITFTDATTAAVVLTIVKDRLFTGIPLLFKVWLVVPIIAVIAAALSPGQLARLVQPRNCSSTQPKSCDEGIAPDTRAFSRPCANRIIVGMPRMPNCVVECGGGSVSIFTN